MKYLAGVGSLLAMSLGLLFSSTTFGYTSVVGDVISVDSPVADDLYTAGGNIVVQERINGDLIMAGGDIDIVGPVEQDLILAGGEVFVSSDIGDDARIFGGTVVIEESIQDDLMIFGGSVIIRDDVMIGGDVYIAGGDVMLGGDIKGNAEINAGEITINARIGGDATIHAPVITVLEGDVININGNLHYTSKESVQSLENSTAGDVTFSHYENNGHQIPFIVQKLFVGLFFVKLLFLIVFGSLVYFGLPALTKLRTSHLACSPGKAALTGILRFVITPVLVLFLFGTLIGVPVGIGFLTGYALSFLFFELANVVVFSRLFMNHIESASNSPKHWLLHLGLIILLALGSTIIAGIDLIAGVFTLGALLMTIRAMIKKA